MSIDESAKVEQPTIDFTIERNTSSRFYLPEIVVFQHANFEGWEYRTNLNHSYVGNSKNDRISSIIVVSGTWEFFRDINFQGPSRRLREGYYPILEAVQIPNDSISSFKAVGL